MDAGKKIESLAEAKETSIINGCRQIIVSETPIVVVYHLYLLDCSPNECRHLAGPIEVNCKKKRIGAPPS